MKRLSVSFSGGETSAYMTHWILNNWQDRFDEIHVIFANTGQEHPRTLEFVHACDTHLGFNTTWIEAVVDPAPNAPAQCRQVTFETASRDGAPFEQVIAKYGLPNRSWPHCTRNLKERAMQAWYRSMGWPPTYYTAIGIRADEIDRMSASAEKRRLLYPLVTDHPTTKPQITHWWRQQPFRLNLHAWQGNCTWCWKKSLRKHIYQLRTTPELYDFPHAMEVIYDTVGAEFRKDPSSPPRTMFRENRSTVDLRNLAAAQHNQPLDTPHDSNEFDPALDVGDGCEESCEVYGD